MSICLVRLPSSSVLNISQFSDFEFMDNEKGERICKACFPPNDQTQDIYNIVGDDAKALEIVLQQLLAIDAMYLFIKKQNDSTT